MKVLADIESKAISSAQSLQQVGTQITATEREKRMLELTQKELASYPRDTPVYTGVGKMWHHSLVSTDKKVPSGRYGGSE